MASNSTFFDFFDSTDSRNENFYEYTSCYSRTWTVVVNVHAMFLIIFGFIANLCSFAVLIRPRLRRRPTFSYLAYLSLSNALLSLVYATLAILAVDFDKLVDDLPLFLFCRFLSRFTVDFLTHFSLYTLTAVDLDRIRTVTSKTSTVQRYSRTHGERSRGCPRAFIHVCLIELFLAFVLFLFNLHWLVAFGWREEDPQSLVVRTKCITPWTINETNLSPYSPAYHKYLMSILPVVELLFFHLLPVLMSTLATIVILRHVSMKYSLLNNISKRLKKSRRRMELHLSILLISLNCVFILFNTPHNALQIYLTRFQRHSINITDTSSDFCFLPILQKSFDLLQQCYFMSTFFLYILTNRRFREEFYELLKRNLFFSCGIIQTTHSSSSVSSRTRRHHHHRHRHRQLEIDRDDNDRQQGAAMRLRAPSKSQVETRFSITDYCSQENCDVDDEPVLLSKGYETTTELRLSVNPSSSYR